MAIVLIDYPTAGTLKSAVPVALALLRLINVHLGIRSNGSQVALKMGALGMHHKKK